MYSLSYANLNPFLVANNFNCLSSTFSSMFALLLSNYFAPTLKLIYWNVNPLHLAISAVSELAYNYKLFHLVMNYCYPFQMFIH